MKYRSIFFEDIFHYCGIKKEGDRIKFREKERYRIYNTLSENHGYFLTIIKVLKNKVYYLFDGDEEIKFFEVGSQFEFDLIKVV